MHIVFKLMNNLNIQYRLSYQYVKYQDNLKKRRRKKSNVVGGGVRSAFANNMRAIRIHFLDVLHDE